MDDADLRVSLSQHGRTYVEEQHDWRTVTSRLVEVYEQAITAHAKRRRSAGEEYVR